MVFLQILLYVVNVWFHYLLHGYAHQLAFLKHNVATAMRLTNTDLKNILRHPKDKKDITEISDAVYATTCKSCDKSYIGETGQLFGTGLKEHQKDSEKIKDIRFTRVNRKDSTSEQQKSVITDHIAQEKVPTLWQGA